MVVVHLFTLGPMPNAKAAGPKATGYNKFKVRFFMPQRLTPFQTSTRVRPEVCGSVERETSMNHR
jgi:hypothetical protein